MPSWHGTIKIIIIFIMLIDCNHNLIAAWRSIEDVVPNPQYKSGAKEGDKPVYQDDIEASSNPTLTLEFDILNKWGFGLKRGFYEIMADPEFSYLMFVQSNEIKAKIPIIKREVINEYGTDYEWGDEKDKSMPNSASRSLDYGVMIASKKTYKPIYTDKELKRRKKKYQKGKDPSTYFHSTVKMEYDKELEAYKIIWEKYNTRLIGIMKI